MGRMKELYTILQEGQQLLRQDQLFPAEEEELTRLADLVRPLLQPRDRGIQPSEDQTSFIS